MNQAGPTLMQSSLAGCAPHLSWWHLPLDLQAEKKQGPFWGVAVRSGRSKWKWLPWEANAAELSASPCSLNDGTADTWSAVRGNE